MTKLFDIIGFCFAETAISVDTTYDESPFILNKNRFEKWVDDRELRVDKKSGYILAWDYYYTMLAEKDLYEYIIIMQGPAVFDIEVPLKRVLMN